MKKITELVLFFPKMPNSENLERSQTEYNTAELLLSLRFSGSKECSNQQGDGSDGPLPAVVGAKKEEVDDRYEVHRCKKRRKGV